jgi:hypothetical protein
LQLIRTAALVLLVAEGAARADDHVETTNTWYEESRRGGKGGLTVLSPMFDLAFDLGESTNVDLGYTADAVTGATAAIYSVDAVSSATTFSDFREEGKLGLTFTGRRSSFNVGATVGAERDYLSITVGGGGSIDLPGKNTTLAVAYAHNFDQVCDHDNSDASTPLEHKPLSGLEACNKKDGIFGQNMPGLTVWHDLSIDTAQGTLTQNLSPTMNLQLAVWGQIINGFQSDPYRRVQVGMNEPQEQVPTIRDRLAVSAKWNRFFPKLHSALHFNVRGYSDTWGVEAAAAEMAWSQYFGDSLLIDLHGRISQQTAATFFKDAFFYETESTAGAYFTGDRELSPVRNIVAGARLSILSTATDQHKVWGVFEHLTFSLKGDLINLDQLPADKTELNQAGTDNQFLTSGLLNAFVLQFSLLATF